MPEVAAKRIIQTAGTDKNTCIGILGLSFNAGSDDVRDTSAAKIVRELNKQGYLNIIGYDPMAIEEFKRHYTDLTMSFEHSYDEVVNKAAVLAITTAWGEFKNIKEKTKKRIVDCRYML